MDNHYASCTHYPVDCDNDECPFTGPRHHMDHHRDTDCPYATVACRHAGCDANMRRRDAPHHEDACLYRTAPCELCGETVSAHTPRRTAHLRACVLDRARTDAAWRATLDSLQKKPRRN